MLGDDAYGIELLEPLRALEPELDTFAPASLATLSRLHMDPEQPIPATTDHQLLSDLPPAGIDALLSAAGPGSGSRLVTVELRQLGGALSRSAPGSGALASIDAPLAFIAGGVVDGPAAEAKVGDDLARLRQAITPWAAGRYLNFTERPEDPATMFPPETYDRLRRVNARVDPLDLFRSNHPITPAWTSGGAD